MCACNVHRHLTGSHNRRQSIVGHDLLSRYPIKRTDCLNDPAVHFFSNAAMRGGFHHDRNPFPPPRPGARVHLFNFYCHISLPFYHTYGEQNPCQCHKRHEIAAKWTFINHFTSPSPVLSAPSGCSPSDSIAKRRQTPSACRDHQIHASPQSPRRICRRTSAAP